jgi:predicted transcriptional regulator
MHITRITIVYEGKPGKYDINDLLQWYGASLGLFNLRDRDKSCFRIFIVLLRSLQKSKQLTSDEIAEKLNLSRGTVIHHLNRLMDSGIVISQRNKYFIDVKNLEELTEVIRGNMNTIFDDLKKIAKDIDDRLEL